MLNEIYVVVINIRRTSCAYTNAPGVPAPAKQERLTLLGATRYLSVFDVGLLRGPQIIHQLG
jgi:hypothetical protein